MEGGPKRSSTTRAPGSLTQEGRQARALVLAAVLSRRMPQPPLLLPPPSPAVSTDGAHAGPQPWLSHAGAALGSGRRKRICSMFPALPLSPPCPGFFFPCGSREQPVSQITEAVTDTAGSCEALCTAPDSSPPPSCTWDSHQNAQGWVHPPSLGMSAGCCRRCGGQQQNAQPPHLAKADSEMPTMGSEGPAAYCQVGKGRNANGIQVLANGFAASWECGPDMRLQSRWMVEQGDLRGC